MAGDRTRERGELEGEVMQILWATDEPISARDIQDRFSGHTPAYTTLMTALDRLERKGQVQRQAESPRKVRFTPTHSAGEHAGERMLTALNNTGDREAALLQFAGNLDDADIDLLMTAFNRSTRKRKRR